jgi:hypothetical protein
MDTTYSSERLTHAIASEVRIDPARLLTREVAQALRGLLVERGVLIF